MQNEAIFYIVTVSFRYLEIIAILLVIDQVGIAVRYAIITITPDPPAPPGPLLIPPPPPPPPVLAVPS